MSNMAGDWVKVGEGIRGKNGNGKNTIKKKHSVRSQIFPYFPVFPMGSGPFQGRLLSAALF